MPSRSRKKPAEPPLPSIPLLSADELEMLRLASYDHPMIARGTARVKIADRLVAAGLLERDPSAPRLVRCTTAGERACALLTRRGAERVTERILDLADSDPEEATALERALWQRVLAELALEEPPGRQLCEIAGVALRTAARDFPRGY